jgi:hypothetical protein
MTGAEGRIGGGCLLNTRKEQEGGGGLVARYTIRVFPRAMRSMPSFRLPTRICLFEPLRQTFAEIQFRMSIYPYRIICQSFSDRLLLNFTGNGNIARDAGASRRLLIAGSQR